MTTETQAQPISAKLTPLMKQYWDVKSVHSDKIVFFRMGDFYELFFQDAQTVAPLLGLTLTSRNKKAEDETPMCGMPHHSVAGYINRLLALGFKIAICDQIQDPKEAKGIVERAVTRILSPGMVYDPNVLEGQHPNYLASWDGQDLSLLEPTTGEAFYYKVSDPQDALRFLEILRPVEVVLEPGFREKLVALENFLKTVAVSEVEFERRGDATPLSAQRLVAYATQMQGAEITSTLRPFVERKTQSSMNLTPTTLRHLEIFETYRGEAKGSLFSAIDRTKTWSGARRLKSWLQFPLFDLKEIEDRQSHVERWSLDFPRLQNLRSLLTHLGDVERRLGKISSPTCSPRDLVALRESLEIGIQASQLDRSMVASDREIQTALELKSQIQRTLVDEPPVSPKEGHLIRKGFSSSLDELIGLTDHANEKLLQLEIAEREATQIPSLKVRYNNVFGYYIEITKTHAAKVPGRYQRKQTLVNAERFTTPELHELEEKILSAQVRRNELEFQIFSELRQAILEKGAEILRLAAHWSELDVYQALAWLALESRYVRPQFSQASELHLVNARHPVIEQKSGVTFVPNSLKLQGGECLLLTGPNMAGKSTLMRQVAIATILAQIGSFVPAENAVLPLVDRIFTRIGSSDSLSEGLSTFMVEMKETAELVSKCTSSSLVILDEIGRGTSTYDGLSLAQAILEFLITAKKPFTLFATHYHELTGLAMQFPQIRNAHMSIREKGGEILFAHALKEGPANKSYGIEVAKLAGLPKTLLRRASEILIALENQRASQAQDLFSWGHQQNTVPNEEPVESSSSSGATEDKVAQHLAKKWKELEQQLRDLDVNDLTPIQALNWLSEFRSDIMITNP